MSNTRCKAGDLAMITHSVAGNEGKVVTCIKYVGKILNWLGEDYWEVDQELNFNDGNKRHFSRDAWMRPIGNPDGEDETFQWAGKPKVALLD